MERFDLVVVGAGWHGLAMAKAYCEVCPAADVLIVDSASSIGGVWAKERLYPGLKTNNLIGSYEFGDFPMTEAFGVAPGQHIPGAVVHDYLSQFAAHFGLTERTRLRTVVQSAELQGNGEWRLTITDKAATANTSNTTLTAAKLVIATGLTSEPSMPTFQGQETFTGNMFHSLQLKERAKDIESAKEVVVLGANKSAWDVCYSAAAAGAHVNMVIRPGGGGPSYVWPVAFTPLQLSIQRLATTRIFTLFEPCIWAGAAGFGWVRRTLHNTWLGRKVVSAFWTALGHVVTTANGYSGHPELRKLKPWTSTFWMGNSLGIHNFDQDWFDLVRQGRIHIHIAEVASLSESLVHLSNGTTLPAETFVCCTGWKIVPPIKFLPDGISTELGLPSLTREHNPVARQARVQISRTFPDLGCSPRRTLTIPAGEVPVDSANRSGRPYQLYRFMVPSSKQFIAQRSIAFIGAHLAINAVTVAQGQALWITAFFLGRIEHLQEPRIDATEIEYSTLLHSEFCRLRHPPAGGGAGERCPDLVFDGLLYTDLLLDDLRLNALRKRGLWQELFHRYLPKDYAGLVTQWQDRQRELDAGSVSNRVP